MFMGIIKENLRLSLFHMIVRVLSSLLCLQLFAQEEHIFTISSAGVLSYILGVQPIIQSSAGSFIENDHSIVRVQNVANTLVLFEHRTIKCTCTVIRPISLIILIPLSIRR